MIPAPAKTTSYPMYDTFIALKNNQPLPDDMCLLEAYYFIKAHKLAALDHFLSYWTDGRSKQLLRRILTAHYPPLDYCHSEENGFDLLSDYVAIAKTVF